MRPFPPWMDGSVTMALMGQHGHFARLAGLAAIVAVSLSAGAVIAGPINNPKAVVELFTSQGCTSCPPADALLGRLAGEGDIIALSFNVDYWDYLGWRDTLASHENTERQRAYAAARGERQVYTPQMVINGESHVIGSDEDAVRQEIENGALPVSVSLSVGADGLSVAIGDGAGTQVKRATIWLALIDKDETVTIARGENRDKTITYHNVVRRMQRIGMWKGVAKTHDLPWTVLRSGEKSDGCAVILQTETEAGLPGPVLGAALEMR